MVSEVIPISVQIVSVPYRGATFLNSSSRKSSVSYSIVSVPYRGATFLNDKGTLAVQKARKIVSVPYRGATFLNTRAQLVE